MTNVRFQSLKTNQIFNSMKIWFLIFYNGNGLKPDEINTTTIIITIK